MKQVHIQFAWHAFLLIAALLFVGIFAMSAYADEKYETPRYTLVSKQDAFEIRDYPPQLVAEVTIKGDRSEAANKGFRVLADFIFGGNATSTSVAMTAPVMQEIAPPSSRSIMPSDKDSSAWVVRFMMPSQFTKETLPTPKDNRIAIRELAGYRAASITFTGLWTESNLGEHVKKLKAFIAREELQVIAKPAYAFYNDPFTWPWSRRNEIIVALAPGVDLKNK